MRVGKAGGGGFRSRLWIGDRFHERRERIAFDGRDQQHRAERGDEVGEAELEQLDQARPGRSQQLGEGARQGPLAGGGAARRDHEEERADGREDDQDRLADDRNADQAEEGEGAGREQPGEAEGLAKEHLEGAPDPDHAFSRPDQQELHGAPSR